MRLSHVLFLLGVILVSLLVLGQLEGGKSGDQLYRDDLGSPGRDGLGVDNPVGLRMALLEEDSKPSPTNQDIPANKDAGRGEQETEEEVDELVSVYSGGSP